MKVTKTKFPGLVIIEPKIFEDSRGYFFESFNKKMFNELVEETEFVQDNQSKSAYGTIRGLHYQLEPYAQAKLIRVLQGKILDVVVDLEKNHLLMVSISELSFRVKIKNNYLYRKDLPMAFLC